MISAQKQDLAGDPAVSGHSLEDYDIPIRAEDFARLRDLLYRLCGVALNETKIKLVYGRLSNRLRTLGVPDFTTYCQLLENSGSTDELNFFVNALTTNHTSFFREAHHFDHFRDNLLTPANQSGATRLRIWSAACSYGEEPYTIAMCLAGLLQQNSRRDVKILATDINTDCLKHGRDALYPMSACESLPKPYRKFLVPEGVSGFGRIDPRLRRLVTFKHLNLMQDWPMKGPFDAVFCRNVMIYFDRKTRETLCNRIYHLLKPGGWLYIGHSETLQMIDTPFRLAGRTIYQRPE